MFRLTLSTLCSTLFLTVVAKVCLAAATNAVTCPPTAEPVRAKIDVENDQIILCNAEKWPGLAPAEYYVTVATHDSKNEDPLVLSIVAVVLNTKTNSQYPAPKPNSYYYWAKAKESSKMLNQLVKSALAKQVSPAKQRFETQLFCKGETPEPHLSLAMVGEGYEWQIEFESGGHCEAIQIGEKPRFISSDIIIHPSRLHFDASTGEPEIKNLSLEILPRQSYSDYHNDRDYLRDMIQSSNEDCQRKEPPLKLLAKKSPVYEANRWHTDVERATTTGRKNSLDGQLALSVELPSQANEAFLSTPTQGAHKKSAQIYLEERNSLDETRVIGAWQVSSYFELRNLIYYGDNKNPKRIVFRDPKCGRETASNWISE